MLAFLRLRFNLMIDTAPTSYGDDFLSQLSWINPLLQKMEAFSTTTSGTVLANSYKKLNNAEAMSQLVVMPPYQDKGTVPYVRGNIKIRANGTRWQDFVFTGPKLQVTYSGCRWNKIHFNMDDQTTDFRNFLNSLSKTVNDTVWMNPGKYKQGAMNSSRFLWDHDMLIKPSSESGQYMIKSSSEFNQYPDELKVRLSTHRDYETSEPDTAFDIVDTYLYAVDEASNINMEVKPEEIQAGDTILPVFRASYMRNIDRFYLVLTLLKGEVTKDVSRRNGKIMNVDYMMDIDGL